MRKANKAGALKARAMTTAKRERATAVVSPVREFRIRELDPVKKCGPATSVQRLYKVDETVGDAVTSHLVFFDRHGWYCEHGRDCPAVLPAKKFQR